jgi:hypothetical protein
MKKKPIQCNSVSRVRRREGRRRRRREEMDGEGREGGREGGRGENAHHLSIKELFEMDKNDLEMKKKTNIQRPDK